MELAKLCSHHDSDFLMEFVSVRFGFDVRVCYRSWYAMNYYFNFLMQFKIVCQKLFTYNYVLISSHVTIYALK